MVDCRISSLLCTLLLLSLFYLGTSAPSLCLSLSLLYIVDCHISFQYSTLLLLLISLLSLWVVVVISRKNLLRFFPTHHCTVLIRHRQPPQRNLSLSLFGSGIDSSTHSHTLYIYIYIYIYIYNMDAGQDAIHRVIIAGLTVALLISLFPSLGSLAAQQIQSLILQSSWDGVIVGVIVIAVMLGLANTGWNNKAVEDEDNGDEVSPLVSLFKEEEEGGRRRSMITGFEGFRANPDVKPSANHVNRFVMSQAAPLHRSRSVDVDDLRKKAGLSSAFRANLVPPASCETRFVKPFDDHTNGFAISSAFNTAPPLCRSRSADVGNLQKKVSDLEGFWAYQSLVPPQASEIVQDVKPSSGLRNGFTISPPQNLPHISSNKLADRSVFEEEQLQRTVQVIQQESMDRRRYRRRDGDYYYMDDDDLYVDGAVAFRPWRQTRLPNHHHRRGSGSGRNHPNAVINQAAASAVQPTGRPRHRRSSSLDCHENPPRPPSRIRPIVRSGSSSTIYSATPHLIRRNIINNSNNVDIHGSAIYTHYLHTPTTPSPKTRTSRTIQRSPSATFFRSTPDDADDEFEDSISIASPDRFDLSSDDTLIHKSSSPKTISKPTTTTKKKKNGSAPIKISPPSTIQGLHEVPSTPTPTPTPIPIPSLSRSPSTGTDSSVNTKAEAFINKFREQMRLQQAKSLERYRQRLERGV